MSLGIEVDHPANPRRLKACRALKPGIPPVRIGVVFGLIWCRPLQDLRASRASCSVMSDSPNASPTSIQTARPTSRSNVRRLLRILALVLVVLLLWFSAKIWTVVRAPVAQPSSLLVPEFLALKQRLDPTNKFRNELLDKYLRPREPYAVSSSTIASSTGQ